MSRRVPVLAVVCIVLVTAVYGQPASVDPAKLAAAATVREKAWAINKEAAVTVVVYARKGGSEVFGFKDTASAAAKASDIASAAKKALGK